MEKKSLSTVIRSLPLTEVAIKTNVKKQVMGLMAAPPPPPKSNKGINYEPGYDSNGNMVEISIVAANNIVYKIQWQISYFENAYRRQPDSIVLHPNDIKIIEQDFPIQTEDKKLIICGLKIYRSLDIEQGEFKVF